MAVEEEVEERGGMRRMDTHSPSLTHTHIHTPFLALCLSHTPSPDAGGQLHRAPPPFRIKYITD
jgi:hypothetical protein